MLQQLEKHMSKLDNLMENSPLVPFLVERRICLDNGEQSMVDFDISPKRQKNSVAINRPVDFIHFMTKYSAPRCGARTALVAAAESGNAEAQYTVAESCLMGSKTMAQDFHVARIWAERSAAQGFSHSQFLLGYLYEEGLDVEQDFALAAEYFRKAAAQGHAGAMRHLGTLYKLGLGVEQNLPEAVRLFGQAAELGNPYAAWQQGYMYEHGLGVAQDREKAVALYEPALDYGVVEAWLAMAAFKPDVEDEMWKKSQEMHFWEGRIFAAAEWGNPDAAYYCGHFMENGGETGVGSDKAKAIAWYTVAVNSGHTRAAYRLAQLYLENLTNASSKKAQRVYSLIVKAYEKGDTDAAVVLGKLVINGVGCEKDEKWGLGLMKEAAAKGSLDARDFLEKNCPDAGDFAGIAYEKAVQALIFKLEKDPYDFQIKKQLARFYREGIGTEKDPQKALELLDQTC